jgi:hypothetical protein
VIENTPALDTPRADATPARYVRCAPGETISDPRPGDIILIRGTGWLGCLIRMFERMRYRSAEDRVFAHWSHAAIVVGRNGFLVEVLHKGVMLSRLEKYRDQDYRYIRLDLSDAERKSAASYACLCLRQRYGVSSFLLFAASLLAGDRWRIRDRGQQGCVALIVRALQRAGVNFERQATDMMPADLAKHFGVRG